MNLFISYRRDDSEGFAGWLADLLRSPTDGSEPDQVFLDVDDIAPGENFVRDMIAAVSQADAVLVLIGKDWVRPSLHKSGDPVRLEIEEAIKTGIPLYCVLVDNASAPKGDALPASLKSLTSVPHAVLTEGAFSDDVRKLHRRLMAAVRPNPRGRTVRTACLEVFHANPGFWMDNSSFSVVLDGKSLGTVMANTPPHRFDIAPGKHRIQCRRGLNGLRRSDIVEFEVTAGSRARVDVTLALTGGLECQLSSR